MANKLFSTDLSSRQFVEFDAEDFQSPVCGVIHRKEFPARNGMPLGSVGTGCIDLETDGTFGYATIFNSHVPRRGPLNLPFMGLCLQSDGQMHESWVLSTTPLRSNPMPGPFTTSFRPKRACPAEDIHYWGHYPVADIEYDLDCSVSAGMRAWAPFIPGDTAVSNTPGAVFEVHLRNSSEALQTGMIFFSFPGPSPEESLEHSSFSHTLVNGAFNGVLVGNGSNQEYTLGGIGENIEWQFGGDLGCDGGMWSRIGSELSAPNFGLPPALDRPGASVAAKFVLHPGEESVIRFILAWYSPTWQGGGQPMKDGNTYYHKYADRYGNAREVAEFLAVNHEELLARIIAWQEVLYAEKALPVWLRESLVNNLHLITEDGFWGQARTPIGDWCSKEDGLFGMNECPRGCPQIECIPCSFYGNIPLVYFFPDLALTTLRGYKAYQYPDGAAPWIFGGITGDTPTPPCELAMPSKGYGHKPQATLDGPCYVDMIARLWQRTGDKSILSEFYDSMKRNTIFTMNMRPESGAAGIVSIPTGNNAQDWMESCDLFGIVPHIGGVHLANLRMAESMAREAGDVEFANQCAKWFQQGSDVLEDKTWTGDYYLLYLEEETGKKSDVIMGCQLDGEWMARFHGLEGVFRDDRVKTTLETLQRTNIYEHGATVFRLRQAGKFLPGYWGEAGVHFPSSIMLAATYLYHSDSKTGLDLAERTVNALVIENSASWDSMLLFRGDNAEFLWGADYYQNMMLWSLPAAIASTDISGVCQPGGLVARMLEAAKEKKL